MSATATVTPTQALESLVRTPSVSASERAAIERFAEIAGSLGFTTEIDETGNTIATRGAADASFELALLGHIDTVPGEIPVRIEDGELWGRGAVDAKGPLIAMLFAAAQADLPAHARVRVMAAVGEEAPESVGARALAQRFRPGACIVGEPSGWDGVTIGYKGRLLAECVVERSGVHSAGPEDSAADAAMAWWRSARELAQGLTPDARGVFETVQANAIEISSEADGLADCARVRLGFRLPPSVAPEELAVRLRGLAPEGSSIQIAGATPAWATTRSDPVARALSVAIREHGAQPRPKRKTGTADTNIVAPVWNCPMAAYGPGDSSLDHTPEERLSLEELDRSVAVLRSAIELIVRGCGPSYSGRAGAANVIATCEP